MRLVLITGFLGSGKTTVLLSLAGYLSRRTDPKRIVIIENEIGEANVDGLLMTETAYEVRDLTAGCICCTLSGQLVNALTEIKNDLDPEWLLVEATGIAHQTIADVIRQTVPGLRPLSLVVVDAQRWDELMDNLPMLIMAQVEKADLILINKIESLSAADLTRVEEEVRELNQRQPCHKISAATDDLSGLWQWLTTGGNSAAA